MPTEAGPSGDDYVLLEGGTEGSEHGTEADPAELRKENSRLTARLLELERQQEWFMDNLAKGRDAERAELLKAVTEITDERNALEQELKHSEKEFATMVSEALEERLADFRTQFMQSMPKAAPGLKAELTKEHGPQFKERLAGRVSRASGALKRLGGGALHQTVGFGRTAVRVAQAKGGEAAAHLRRLAYGRTDKAAALALKGLQVSAVVVGAALICSQKRQLTHAKKLAKLQQAKIQDLKHQRPAVQVASPASPPLETAVAAEVEQQVDEADPAPDMPNSCPVCTGLKGLVDTTTHLLPQLLHLDELNLMAGPATAEPLDPTKCPVAQFFSG